MNRIYLSLAFLLFFRFSSQAVNLTKPEQDIEQILTEFVQEKLHIHLKFSTQKIRLYDNLEAVNRQLHTVVSLEEKVSLLLQKDLLKEQLSSLVLSEATEISKLRYLKGLSIIKILYEKILALDHHFASLSTFREINNISNPNNYPEFSGVKELIKNSSAKKEGLELTHLLGNNVYTNIAGTLIGLFNSSANKETKQVELEKVECILDFTLRMHQDLNTIYFETAFLQKSNDHIKSDIEQLFVDYTKPIGYHTPLKACRNADDWDVVRNKLDDFLETLDSFMGDTAQQVKAHRMRVNLEFPIDRLLQFITQYNAFIDQGAKFYEKFKIILDSYEHEQQCQNSIPPEYMKLKKDIDIAIEKFNTAYKPVEINGSKMKEILYGINEYE
jgi:hypothetical protein